MSQSSALHPFEFEGKPMRFLVLDGEPWAVLADVCRLLEHSNPSVALRLVEPEDFKRVKKTDIPILNWDSPQPIVTLVNESGFYALTFSSRAEGARRLKRWVTREVLPQIRQTGGYGPQRELTRRELIQLALEAEEERERLSLELAAAAPKVETYDALLAAEKDWSLREAAAVLNRDPVIRDRYKLGQNILYWLMLGERPLHDGSQLKMLDRHGRIYSTHKEHLVMRPNPYEHPHTGEPRVSEQVRVTSRGVVYLQKRFGGGKPAVLQLETDGKETPAAPATARITSVKLLTR